MTKSMKEKNRYDVILENWFVLSVFGSMSSTRVSRVIVYEIWRTWLWYMFFFLETSWLDIDPLKLWPIRFLCSLRSDFRSFDITDVIRIDKNFFVQVRHTSWSKSGDQDKRADVAIDKEGTLISYEIRRRDGTPRDIKRRVRIPQYIVPPRMMRKDFASAQR